jgi:dTDP-4-dehydrorhamnose 3,5-epimerase
VIIGPTALAGVHLVTPERLADARGSFARTFCADAFAAAGLPTSLVQCSASLNLRRGTLRGLHWQADPHGEGKLVRCTRGVVFDVAVDLRPGSPTWGRWAGWELSAENGHAVFIPPGFAHGFQTLVDASEVFYQMTERYHADLSRGARWDDPAFGIAWPVADPILSPRDAGFALRLP